MVDEAQLSPEDLLALVSSANELSSEIDLEELLDKIVRRGCELTNSPSGSIFLDDDGRGLFAAAAAGPKAEGLLFSFGEATPNRVPYEGSKAGRVFVTGETLIEASVESDPEHFKVVDEKLKHRTESMLCVPLITGESRVGVIQILNKANGNYTTRDVSLLTHLACHAALAINNARLIRELLAHKGLFSTASRSLKSTDLLRELSAPAHRERMTVLFADMRGFTPLLREIGDPSSIVVHLNQFLQLLADQVLAHDGVVNKFLGDGVLALFRGKDTELRAGRAAFDIVGQFDLLKEKWKNERNEALNFLDIGVGIVTGDVVIGSIGGGRVRDFTAIGTFVNLAAAFETDARGGKRIFTDQSTFSAIRSAGLIAGAEEQTIYEMRKPDQRSGVEYNRYLIRPPSQRQTDDVKFNLERYYRSSWAVVVGINEYGSPQIPHLSYALSDVRSVAEALPGVGFPSHQIQVLENENATKANIENAIYGIRAQMDLQDRLLIFFALHGQVFRYPGGEEGFLLPYDADPNNLPLTGLPMIEFAHLGRRLPAKHILLMLDTCFSGYAAKRDAMMLEGDLDVEVQERVVEVLTAGTSGQKAEEEGGHGVFTRAFLNGLRGAADPKGTGLTALKLAVFIKEQLLTKPQTPQVSKLDGEGEFLFHPPRPLHRSQS